MAKMTVDVHDTLSADTILTALTRLRKVLEDEGSAAAHEAARIIMGPVTEAYPDAVIVENDGIIRIVANGNVMVEITDE